MEKEGETNSDGSKVKPEQKVVLELPRLIRKSQRLGAHKNLKRVKHRKKKPRRSRSLKQDLQRRKVLLKKIHHHLQKIHQLESQVRKINRRVKPGKKQKPKKRVLNIIHHFFKRFSRKKKLKIKPEAVAPTSPMPKQTPEPRVDQRPAPQPLKIAMPKSKENQEPSTITIVKQTKIQPNGSYETQIDALYHLVEKEGEIRLEDAAKKCHITAELAEEWAKILESHELLTINYSTFGTIILVKRQPLTNKHSAGNKA